VRVRPILWLAVVACGSKSPPPAPAPAPVPVAPPPAIVVDEQAKHDQLAAAHRQIESEQQDALAAKCDRPNPPAARDEHPRCQPSCYATEPPDLRAGKSKSTGAVAIDHLACGSEDAGPFVLADELEPGKLGVHPVRGRFPRAHKHGTWQLTVETALAAAQLPKLARGDEIVVAGAWHEVVHPMTKERLRCVKVVHYTRLRKALDGCGADGSLACEAVGDAAARGLNVVHYRLAEARALQAAGKSIECQQASLEAIAVARGLPRWRQYAKLNVGAWPVHAGYRTRFDGTLDEDTLFATAAELGTAAQAIFVACGGASTAATTAGQEQSFHTCW
jgi:hypothetical protein